MIRETGEKIGRAVLDGIGRTAGRVQERKPLPSDLLESDDAYLIVFDAPGAEGSDVSVSFEGNTVEVQIDRFRAFHDGYEMRFPGRGLSLSGSVALPEAASVDPDGAEATLTNNGTLEVHIPKHSDEPHETASAEAESGDPDSTDEPDDA
ncbi:MAG: Hsp20/alpha crystallin family protein [Natronomonas sp.]